MYSGKIVFSQVMDHLPMKEFRRCVDRYQGHHKVQGFSCLDQFLSMAFAQLTYRESLRDIEACLRAQQMKLYHMGIRSDVSRSTLAYANETRDWKIYADFSQVLIHIARDLYAQDDFGVELKETVNVLDEILPEAGSFYVMDRGYLDFERLYVLAQALAFFVTRSKINFGFRRLYSHPIEKTTGVQCDQTIVLTGFYSAKDYPDKMRRIRYFDAERDKDLTFLTNNFLLPSLTIAQLYKCRWQVELFFKWIKQHLRIKRFFGTSENAVKTQVWIAVSIYVLVAIMKKRLNLEESLYTILQILSVTAFEKMPILQALEGGRYRTQYNEVGNQLSLFG